MSANGSVNICLGWLKAGQCEAARQPWQHYLAQLVRLACRDLGQTPRCEADEEDVVLSAFNGSLQGVADGQFLDLRDRDDPWQTLVVLTERKAIAHWRRARASKRGNGRVLGESVFAKGEGAALIQSLGPEPTPALAAELNSELRQPLEKLSEETLRRIAAGTLEGCTIGELAQRFGIGLPAVERKLSIIRSKWQRGAGDESS